VTAAVDDALSPAPAPEAFAGTAVRPDGATSCGAGRVKAFDVDDEFDAVDVIDPDLFPIFEEEALDLLPRLAASCAAGRRRRPAAPRNELLRLLHTFKGSARLAGAMRLGEMAHRMESEVEGLGEEGLEPAALDVWWRGSTACSPRLTPCGVSAKPRPRPRCSRPRRAGGPRGPAPAPQRPLLPPTVQWVPQRPWPGSRCGCVRNCSTAWSTRPAR
jgi:chemosensory pili system protein ChpA (sensor histidine kinase/response regulator)